ncbi:ankyrin repeat, SAM and basic leucine zipper domain-containing protein 1 isoform X2 [Hyperolius riggenbachi]|uniref:ankyrin repeat, SAM and basic leucine zipper domain-containing protein 1 isoform X2 n=1 Tax=Hyperolius riggenbachi TaxID=752182 RepID=UPI0035A266D9
MASCFFQAVAGGGESSESDDDWFIGECKEMCEKQSKLAKSETSEEALKQALTLGNVKLVKELLDSGQSVDCCFQFGWTPLMYAASVANLELVRLLLDRGANADFERDKFTVLMTACTAHATEENIVKCVELLLSRNVNTNACCRKNTTALMLAAREGHSQVVTLLVGNGADINAQDENGFTIFSILTFSGNLNGCNLSKAEAMYRYLKVQPESTASDTFRYTASSDLDVFLHGLGLGHLGDIFTENNINLRQLLSMEEEELKKVGVTNLEDCKKIMSALEEIQVEETKLESLPEFSNAESSCDELFAFLLKLNRQCSSLTHAVEDVNNQIPLNAQKVVLEWDSTQNFASVCEDLVKTVTDLSKETCRLQDLLHKFQNAQQSIPCRVPPLEEQQSWKLRKLLKRTTLTLGFGFISSLVLLIVRRKLVL